MNFYKVQFSKISWLFKGIISCFAILTRFSNTYRFTKCMVLKEFICCLYKWLFTKLPVLLVSSK